MTSTEQAQIPDVAAQAVETHDKKTPSESFAELRKKAEDAERRAWQKEKELEMLQRQMQMQAPAQQVPQEDEFDYRQLEQEQFPEGKNLVKAFGKIDKKLSAYEKQLQEKDSKINALEFAVNNADIKEIVTAENIEKYIKSDEDNLESLQKSANPLRKAYNLIKKEMEREKMSLKVKEASISQEQKRVDEKENRPKTGSMGVRSDAITTVASMSNSKLTKAQKDALWADTQKAARK